MAQPARSKFHFQEGSVNEDSHKNNPVPPSFYYSCLSSVSATVRSRVRGAIGRITGKYAAIAPRSTPSLMNSGTREVPKN